MNVRFSDVTSKGRILRYLHHSAGSPAGDIALDEALLDLCEDGTGGAVLRTWEPTQPFVVLGHSCRVAEDVDLTFCTAHNIPIFRRHSGGGTVLQVPGCLNYALVFPMDADPRLSSITGTNGFVMERLRTAVERALGQTVQVDGYTDLTFQGRKFCGNAQRRRLRGVLFHGTLLLSADISLIERSLRVPTRQPSYRKDRGHREFLMNLGVSPEDIAGEMRRIWCAEEDLREIPESRVDTLIHTRFGLREWNFGR